MIDSVFSFLLVKTIGLSLLTLIILIIRPLVLRYLNANVAYQIWLMLPIFLLLPNNLIELDSNSAVMVFFPNNSPLISIINSEELLKNNGSGGLMLIIWSIGLIFSLVLNFGRYQQLNRSLKEFNYELPKQQLTHKANFKKQLVQIRSSVLVDMPAVFGLFKSYLILPHNFSNQSAQQQLMILRHEFYHLARHDHQINFLRVIFKCLFWFNPLVYWADKMVEADQEISCDLGVLNHSPQTEKKQYARSLVESVAGINQNYLVSQWKYQSLIKERIKMLKNTNQKKWHSWVAGVFAITAIWGASHVVAGDNIEAQYEEPKPLTVVNPLYPRKAAMENIEGFVKFKMNLDSSGVPNNIKVIGSEPTGVFDNAASNAIKQWTFKPKVTNGIAVSQVDIQYTMVFKLADDEHSDAIPLPPKK